MRRPAGGGEAPARPCAAGAAAGRAGLMGVGAGGVQLSTGGAPLAGFKPPDRAAAPQGQVLSRCSRGVGGRGVGSRVSPRLRVDEWQLRWRRRPCPRPWTIQGRAAPENPTALAVNPVITTPFGSALGAPGGARVAGGPSACNGRRCARGWTLAPPSQQPAPRQVASPWVDWLQPAALGRAAPCVGAGGRAARPGALCAARRGQPPALTQAAWPPAVGGRSIARWLLPAAHRASLRI